MRSGVGTLARTGRVIAGLGAALLLASTGLAIAPAGATEIVANPPDQVITENKNPTCNDLGYDHGFKINAVPTNGSYDVKDTEHGSNTVVGQVVISDAGDYGFSWSTADSDPDLAFDAVLVKASNKTNAYFYDPASTGDSNLQSVAKDGEDGFHQISHVSFCWGEQEPGEEITVTKRWFDVEGEEIFPDPIPDVEVTVTFSDEGTGSDVTLTEDELAPSEDVDVPDGIDISSTEDSDVTVTETDVANGYEEIDCPQEQVPSFSTAIAVPNVEFVICNQALPDDEVTVRKIWLDSDGDVRDAPSDSDIEITIDVVEGTDEVLTHEDLVDEEGGSVIVITEIMESEVGDAGVDETNVPDGWNEVTCSSAIIEEYGARVDHLFCNRRRSSGGGGGGSTTTTTTTTVAPILPFTPEPEVAPEVLPEVITTTTQAPVLPFTGSTSGRLALAATALLGLGAAFVLASRRTEATAEVESS